MPPPEDFGYEQDAVLWEKVSDDRYSDPTVRAPVAIEVRWEDTAAQVIAPDGRVIRVDAQVKVDREVRIGSIIAKGTVDEYLGTGSATDSGQLMEVVSSETTPDIKARETEYYLGLTKFRRSLPTVI